MRIETWLAENTESLSGKTVVMTGDTGGLGAALCRYLADLGAYLILLDRNVKASEALRSDLFGEEKDARSERHTVDFSDLSSVRRVASELSGRKIDLVLLAAGAYRIPRKRNALGLDNVFQINFLSAYYLMKELLPALRKSAGKAVIVGSIAYAIAPVHPLDPDYEHVKNGEKVYGNSKRYLMSSCTELFRNEKDVRLSVTHPGISPTNITGHYPKALKKLIRVPMKLLFPDPKKACLPILKGVFTETLPYEWIGPSVLSVWGSPKKSRYKKITQDEARFIFRYAEEAAENMRREA